MEKIDKKNKKEMAGRYSAPPLKLDRIEIHNSRKTPLGQHISYDVVLSDVTLKEVSETVERLNKMVG